LELDDELNQSFESVVLDVVFELIDPQEEPADGYVVGSDSDEDDSDYSYDTNDGNDDNEDYNHIDVGDLNENIKPKKYTRKQSKK
jgi:hypothetical protein